MPPKKDNKKKGKPSDFGPAVVDRNDFIREVISSQIINRYILSLTSLQPVDLPILGGVSTLENTISGDFFNCEQLFPEWVDEENYGDVTDNVKEVVVKYPCGIAYTEQKSILEHLGVPSEIEADAKKAKGKGKVQDMVLEDTVADENGKLLPRVYIGTSDIPEEFLSNSITCSFTRHKISPAPICQDETERNEDDGVTAETTEEHGEVPTSPVNQSPEMSAEEDAWGSEIDSLLISAFRLVERFFQDTKNATNAPFLWRGIYPQLPSGKPVLNKAGKYCVRLFVAGKWRKVTVLDVFPIHNGQVAVASSSNPLELWPSILAKGLYTVFTATGYYHTLGGDGGEGQSALQRASFVAFAVHTLTGWSPSAPWDLHDVCAAQTNHLQMHLEEMIFGGATVFSPPGIPTEAAIVAVPEDESIVSI